MPHIVIDRIKEIKYPAEADGVKFLFKAGELVAVQTENAKFLIKILQKEKGYLIKYDKITRPIISEIKKAYNAFAKLNEADVVFENISGIKEKIPDANLLDISDDLSEIDIVEVGFGSGRHLIHLAKKYPEKTVLGIEIHKPSIEQVLKRCIHENITNIRIINHDARIILSKIPSNRLHSIYVHFPVPWDKKPHRRVINVDFISESIRTLEVEGFLHLRTDSDNYFEYSFSEFMKFKQIDLKVKKNIPYEVSSKYEDRWKKMQKDIYDIYMINHEHSEELTEDYDFTFECRLENLDFEPKIYDNFVIHIEKVYKIDDNRELIRATIGNFNRPEHVYILNGERPEYFKHPAPIRENYEAHKELKRLFNGCIGSSK